VRPFPSWSTGLRRTSWTSVPTCRLPCCVRSCHRPISTRWASPTRWCRLARGASYRARPQRCCARRLQAGQRALRRRCPGGGHRAPASSARVGARVPRELAAAGRHAPRPDAERCRSSQALADARRDQSVRADPPLTGEPRALSRVHALRARRRGAAGGAAVGRRNYSHYFGEPTLLGRTYAMLGRVLPQNLRHGTTAWYRRAPSGADPASVGQDSTALGRRRPTSSPGTRSASPTPADARRCARGRGTW
jgi:hypothetical protein